MNGRKTHQAKGHVYAAGLAEHQPPRKCPSPGGKKGGGTPRREGAGGFTSAQKRALRARRLMSGSEQELPPLAPAPPPDAGETAAPVGAGGSTPSKAGGPSRQRQQLASPTGQQQAMQGEQAWGMGSRSVPTYRPLALGAKRACLCLPTASWCSHPWFCITALLDTFSLMSSTTPDGAGVGSKDLLVPPQLPLCPPG